VKEYNYKEKYEMLDHLLGGALVIDKDYNIIFANKVLRDVCGLKGEEVEGKKCHELSHLCPLPCGSESLSFKCPHKEVFSTAGPVTATLIHYCCIAEKERIIDITASPVMDEKGEVREMIEILRDVTEKERQRKKLEEREAFIESVLDGIGDGVVVVDRDFKIISANRGYCNQAKLNRDVIIGRHCYEVSHHWPKPCFEMGERCSAKEVFETGNSHRIIHTHFNKEAHTLHIETISYPLKDASGNVIASIEVLGDISEKIALENELEKKLKELEELNNVLILAFVNAIDAKSPWTKGHSERVANYAAAIAGELGLGEADIQILRTAALLHDVGKIGTYDVILDKSGKLTDDEFSLIRMHPAKGEEILRPIKQLACILPIIRSHHERIDGRGYPDGLKGNEIPLLSRVLCVADSFDSTTADRPYRPSTGKEYAINELRRCSGTQFDPKIVGAFLKVLEGEVYGEESWSSRG